jgi:hypothetical protein
MPTIVGIPAGKMIRTSSSEAADNLGLVRLTESYAFATSEIATFRARLKNMSIHKDVMAFVYPTPTTLYTLVTIESSDISEGAGGIATASVNYTGILVTASSANIYNTPLNTSWLPPAIQRLQPFNSSPNPVQVLVDFIYYSPLPNPEQVLIQSFGSGAALPPTINGTSLYQSLAQPYIEERGSQLSDRGNRGIPREGSTPQPSSYSQFQYFGMRCVAHFSEKIGLFFKVTNTYQDCSAYSSGIGGTALQIQGLYPANFGR